MNKNIIIPILVIVLAVILLIIFKENKKTPIPATNNTDIPKGKMVTGSDIETFSGTISAVDTSCFSDGVCSVTVDGKKIILVKGGRGLPADTIVGKLIGAESIGDLEKKIGQHANVYAGLTPEGDYSLYGNDKYYVEVLDIK